MKTTRAPGWIWLAHAALTCTLAITLAACGGSGGNAGGGGDGANTDTGRTTGGTTGGTTGDKFGSNPGGSTGGGGTTAGPPVARFLLSANSDGTVSSFLVDGATGNVTAQSYHWASAFPVTGLAADPDGAFALIIAGNELQSLTVDEASGLLSHGSTVTAGTAPQEITLSEDGDFAYVTDFADRTLTAFAIGATGTPTRIGSATTGRTPAAVTIHPGGEFVYTADRDDDTVSIFPRNATTGAVSTATTATVGSAPTDIAFNPAGAVAYVTHATDSNNLRVYDVDAASGALTERQTVTAGSNPVAVIVDADGDYLYTANVGSDNVSVFAIDAATGELAAVQNIATGDTPVGLTLGPRGGLLYTAETGSNDTTAFAVDGTTGRLTLIAHVRGRTAMNAVAAVNAAEYGARHADYALAPDGDGIHVYQVGDAAGTLSPLGTVTAGTGSVYAGVDPRGRFVYVPDLYDESVRLYTFDADTGTATISDIDSPAFSGMNLSRAVPEPSGRFLYVLDGRNVSDLSGRIFSYDVNDNGTLTAIDASQAATLTGRNPENLVVHPAGRYLYSIDSYGDTITLFEINATDGRLSQKQTFTPGRSGNGFGRPITMAFHPNGRYAYVTLEDDHEIVRYSVNPGNGFLESPQRTVVPTTDGRPRYIALHPSGELAYSTDWGGDVSTYTVDTSTFALAWTASVNVATGNPSWLAVDPQGGFALLTVTGGTVRCILDGAGTLSLPAQTIDTGTGSSSFSRTVTLAGAIR